MKSVSIIVPIYNAQIYLEKCISSILSQSYKDFELILVDDGSKDESGKICDKWQKKDERIVVIHQENQGVSSARNEGLKRASGTFITFADADDIMKQNYLEVLVNEQDKSNADFVVAAFAWDKRFNRKSYQFYENRIYKDNDVVNVGRKIDMGPWAKLYKKCIIDENNFHFRKDIKFAEDRIFIFQYLRKCKVVSVIDNVIYMYNIKNQSSAVKKYYSPFDEYMRTIFMTECDYHKAIQRDEISQNEKEDLIVFYFEWCLLHYIEHSPKKELIYNIKKTCELIKAVGVKKDYLYSSYIENDDYKGIISKWKRLHCKEYYLYIIKRIIF